MPESPVAKSPSKSSLKGTQRGSAVRVDAARAGAMEECIRKEERIQGQQLKRLLETRPELAASMMHTAPSASSAPAAAEPPELFQTIKAQSQARPDKGSALDISRALANSVNPGYVIRDGQDLKSQTKDSYAVDETELEYMRAHGLLGSEHHRKRNDMSKHVEALARQRLVVKAAQEAAKPPAAAT